MICIWFPWGQTVLTLNLVKKICFLSVRSDLDHFTSDLAHLWLTTRKRSHCPPNKQGSYSPPSGSPSIQTWKRIAFKVNINLGGEQKLRRIVLYLKEDNFVTKTRLSFLCNLFRRAASIQYCPLHANNDLAKEGQSFRALLSACRMWKIQRWNFNQPNYVEIYRYKSFSFTSFDILLIFNLQRGRCRMLSFFWACARCKYAMWARQHTWLLLSFSPIPVRHPLHPLWRWNLRQGLGSEKSSHVEIYRYKSFYMICHLINIQTTCIW